MDVDTNHYSVPWKLIGTEVTVQVDGGRYAFILPDQIARGELRPLRDPKILDDEN